MTTFSVKNFEKFQHYKDRSPPWIKLYNELLDDYEFGRLQDASKMHLISIWLLASRSDNKLPYDSEWVARRINATEPVNLDALAEAGFIVVDQSLHKAEQPASKPLATRLPREEGEERQSRGETEGEAATCVALPKTKNEFGDPELLRIPKTLKRKSRLEGEFVIEEDSDRYRYAKQLGMTDADLDIECDKFENHHRAKGSLMADWDAAWRTWCRNWQTFSQKRRA